MFVTFGEWVLDDEQRLLARRGAQRHLTPKAFDLLVYLVACAPRVVPKAELHKAIWPKTFVSDATLVGLVKEIRRVLDDARQHSHIRTAHRVGYAWAVPVQRAAAAAAPGASVEHWLVARDRTVRLAEGAHVIGRDPAANIRLASTGVSRSHARVVVAGPVVTLEDLGSKNGTRVGGRVADGAVALRHGDVVQLGPVTLEYQVTDGTSTTTETHGGS